MDSLYLTTESSAPRKYKRPNTLVQRDPSDPIVRRAFHACKLFCSCHHRGSGDVLTTLKRLFARIISILLAEMCRKHQRPALTSMVRPAFSCCSARHWLAALTLIANDTFAIDLEESWTNTSVQIKSTPPGGSSRAPVLNLQALWPGEDSNGSGTFYSVGGKPSQPWFDPQYSNTLNVPNALSRCQTSKQGEADWSVVPSDMSSNFPSSRTVQGASAAGAGRGFYLGGLQGDVNAGCRFDCRTPVTPGMLIYDVAKNQWSNVSTERLPSEAVVGGRMHFVPNFGQEGVLVALGGQIRSPTTRDIQSFWPYSTIMVYDIAGGRWYQQPAAGTPQGEIPAPRFSPCIAGARSNDGSPNSYEMYAHFLLPDAVGGNCHAATDTSKRFLYGGGNVLYGSGDQTKDHNDTIPDGSVWILSLPSFSWLKANDTSGTKRMGHTCEVGGSRQMISVGGLAPDPPMRTDGYAAFAQEDPLSNGIGVFDMVDLVWKDSYDAKASPYLKPPAVSSLYSKE